MSEYTSTLASTSATVGINTPLVIIGAVALVFAVIVFAQSNAGTARRRARAITTSLFSVAAGAAVITAGLSGLIVDTAVADARTAAVQEHAAELYDLELSPAQAGAMADGNLSLIELDGEQVYAAFEEDTTGTMQLVVSDYVPLNTESWTGQTVVMGESR